MTLQLAGLALVIAVLIAVPISVIAGLNAGGWFGKFALYLGSAFVSIPNFGLAISIASAQQCNFVQLAGVGGLARQRIFFGHVLRNAQEPHAGRTPPTLSALDPVEQGRLLNLFERLQARHGLTYLFISRDLAMVRCVCTRIAVMYLGKMVEIADTGGVLYDPGDPYTKALLSVVPTLDERPYRTEDVLLDGEPPSPIDIPPGCSFTDRCPEAIAVCRTKEPKLLTRHPGRQAACHVTATEGAL